MLGVAPRPNAGPMAAELMGASALAPSLDIDLVLIWTEVVLWDGHFDVEWILDASSPSGGAACGGGLRDDQSAVR